MALFKAIHGEMSGSIADNTWSHNKGGPYVRERRVPTNPNSTKQTFARAQLATLSSAWQGLTQAQRDGWEAYATLNPVVNALGTTINLSGQSMYVSLNCRLLGAGVARVDTAPIGASPAQITSTTTTPTVPNSLSVAFTPTPLAAAERLQVWMTPPGSAGRNPNFNQARLIGYGPLADATPTVFTTPFGFVSGNAFNLFTARMDGAGRTSPVIKERVLIP
jgi:hypothetical protein